MNLRPWLLRGALYGATFALVVGALWASSGVVRWMVERRVLAAVAVRARADSIRYAVALSDSLRHVHAAKRDTLTRYVTRWHETLPTVTAATRAADSLLSVAGPVPVVSVSSQTLKTLAVAVRQDSAALLMCVRAEQSCAERATADSTAMALLRRQLAAVKPPSTLRKVAGAVLTFTGGYLLGASLGPARR